MMRTWSQLLCVLAMACPALAAIDPPMGVTAGNGSTTVRVWAPNASSVELAGDFNGWSPSQAERLTKDERTGIWSATLQRSLPRGAYGFRINGNLHRRDPYGRLVSADGRNSVFYDPADFDWSGDRDVTVTLDDAVIYEMHVGTFNDPTPKDGRPATFDDAIKRLDHLVDLGVNVVQLMPVHEFDGMHSWGYNPSDLFAVEQTYGGPDALKRFVKACHDKGLAVHLDIVHNHYGPQNLDLLRFDGSGNDRNGGIYFYEGEGIGMTPWGPRVKFSDPMVRRFIRDNAVMWYDEFRLDGFRWDSTINIRAYNMGANALPEGLQMLQAINAELRQRSPRKLSIAEDSLDQGGFHASWDYDFHHNVVPVLKAANDAGRDMRALSAALSSFPSSMGRVIYVDNHDEAGKKNGQVRLASDVDPRAPDSDRARRLCGIGALLTFTAPGTPLFLQGGEFQESGWFHDDIPLNWDKRTKHAGLLALHRDLIRLRRNLDGLGDALKGRGIKIAPLDRNVRQLVYWRWNGDDSTKAMVIGINLSDSPAQKMVIPFPSAGPWRAAVNTDWARYGGANRQEQAAPFSLDGSPARAAVTLPPLSARIFVPAPGAVAGRAQDIEAAPPPPPKPAGPAFSMYAGIHLIGTFNNWDKTAWPLKLVADNTWEGTFVFTNAAAAEFRLSANDDGKIYWGVGDILPTIPFQGPVRRLGPSFRMESPLDGAYRFRFDEEALTLAIESVAPPAAPAAKPASRVWTDLRGRTIEAVLLRIDGDMVTLKRPDGRTVQVRIDQLSEADREALRAAAP